METKNYLEQSSLILKIIEKMKIEERFYDLKTYYSAREGLKDKFIKAIENIELDEFNRIYLKPNDKLLLKSLIELSMLIWGRNANLNFINVSRVEDFSGMFTNKDNKLVICRNLLDYIKQNGKVGQKEINKLVNFAGDWSTIRRHVFNGFIDEWNTGKGIIFKGMFKNSNFNQHELNLDLTSATHIHYMFEDAKYNHDFIVKGELKNLKNASYLFRNSTIQKKIEIDLSHCQKITEIFWRTEKQPNLTFEQIEYVNFGEKVSKNVKRFISLPFFEKIVESYEKESQNEINQSNLLKFLLRFKYKTILNFLDLSINISYKENIYNVKMLKLWLKLLSFNNIKNVYVEAGYLEWLGVVINQIERKRRLKENVGYMIDEVINYLKWYEANYSSEKSLINKKKQFIEKNKVFLEENGLLDYLSLQKGKVRENKNRRKELTSIII